MKWKKLSPSAFETTLGKDQVFVRKASTATARNPLFEIRINGKLIGETTSARDGKTVVERIAAATHRT